MVSILLDCTVVMNSDVRKMSGSRRKYFPNVWPQKVVRSCSLILRCLTGTVEFWDPFYLSVKITVDRCPSVCSSVTLVHCIQTAEDIVKLLSLSGSRIILVFFLTPRAGTQYPSAAAQNRRGLENFEIFDWNRRLSRKRYEIGPWLIWNVNRKSYARYRMVTLSMTSTDF